MPDFEETTPSPSGRAGEGLLVEGVDYYWKGSLVVFTKTYHLKRGYCCGMGCAHCPYDYESVPEPLRSQLHEKEKDNPKA